MGTRERPWRQLADRAIRRPPFDEPLDPQRVRVAWMLVRWMTVFTIGFDVLLWVLARDSPQVRRGALDVFVAINLPCMLGVLALAVAAPRRPGPLIALIVSNHLTVMVWVQATGTLSSYFLVAVVLSIAVHRALLSWEMGVISVLCATLMQSAAFGLEELGWIDRVPLFHDAPGPVYAAAALRWGIVLSIVSVYAVTWMGTNVLLHTLRSTERALGAAERRLAAAAAGVRDGRLSGAQIAGYRLHDMIGRGGMAEVYRGTRDDGATVAVKVMHPHLVDDEHLVARLRREARIAARLPGTVTAAVREVHLAGPGDRAVVLDYLHGEDLAARLRRRGRLPLAEAGAVLVAVCDAVSAIHAAGIVHRDLKPHNLFVQDDGTVRVLDFGVARAEEDESLTQTAMVLGTIGYMAPEMTEGGAAAVGQAGDIYALGVIGFQLFTGARPADVIASDGVAPRLRAFAPELSRELDAVIAIAMARDPLARYPSARAFADDLARALAGTLELEAVRARDPVGAAALEDTAVQVGRA